MRKKVARDEGIYIFAFHRGLLFADKIVGEYWNDRSRYGVTMREHLSGFIDSDGANV